MKVPKQKIKRETVKGLLKRLDEYDRYFDSVSESGEINNQATNAYMALVKFLWGIAADEEAGSTEVSLEEKRRVAEEIFERDYGIKQ